MSSKRIISNPFGHNVPVTGSSNTMGSAGSGHQVSTSSVSSAGGKYGAPPPVGAASQNLPATEPTQSAATVPTVYNPMSSPASVSNAPPPSRYGAPPPPGTSVQTSRPVTTPGQGPTGYQQPQSVPTHKYEPPPPSGTYQAPTNTSINPTQQNGPPPAASSSVAQSAPAEQLSPSQKALKFPSPVELIAGKSNTITKHNTGIHSIPPPAASKFITVDQGNCGPRYMRSSLNTVPGTKDIAKKASLPFGIVLQPLADPVLGEEAVPVVDAGQTGGPLRCSRCRAFMCSQNVFTNGGKTYRCFLCSHINDVPDEYFSPVAANGYRMDYLQRPELCRGSIEYVATGEYLTKSPQPLTYLFVVEVSASAIEMGVLDSFAASLKAILNALPSENVSRFGLITFDSSIQFYNFNAELSKPQLLVVSDLENVFVPVDPHLNLLVNPNDSKQTMIHLLEELPKFTRSSMNTNNAFGAALEAASMVLNESGGKMICFLSSLPTVSPGNLSSRLKSEYLGTDREREFYKPQTSFYQIQAEKLAKAKIGVDLFVFANTYMDLATLTPLCSTTGGQLFYYPRFVPSRDRIKLHHEFHRVLTRTTGYDGIMRVRVGAGLEVASLDGNFMLTFGTDMEVATIDCDKTFVARLRNEEKIPDDSPVGIQCALLYTTSLGERRIRVHSMQLGSSPQMTNVFGGADLETIVYLITSNVLKQSITKPLNDTRRRALDIVVQIVYAFRFYCSTKSFNPQVLVIPEGLKLLPLYIICLLKSVLMKNGRVSVDFRVYSRLLLYSMSVGELTVFLYPRMFALHDMPEEAGNIGVDGSVILPPWQRLLNCTLNPKGCYLLDNGHRMFLWVGKELDPEFLKRVFDANSVDDDLSFNISDDPLANRVKAIISALQIEHPSYKLLITVKQGGEKELLFMQMMFEERVEETMSHSDVLALVHREVCAKLGKPLN